MAVTILGSCLGYLVQGYTGACIGAHSFVLVRIAGTAGLLAELHASCTRILANATGIGCGGLTAAARLARRRGLISNGSVKQLTGLGAAAAWARRVSEPRSTLFLQHFVRELQASRPHGDTGATATQVPFSAVGFYRSRVVVASSMQMARPVWALAVALVRRVFYAPLQVFPVLPEEKGHMNIPYTPSLVSAQLAARVLVQARSLLRPPTVR